MPELKLKSIPSPSNLPPEVQAFAFPVKEAIDLLLGRVGDGKDAAITRRNAGQALGGTTIINTGSASGGGYVPDLTAPPAPTGLVATPGFSVINLEWDDAPYTVGHGHAHTAVYRSSDSLRGNAEMIGFAPGTIYVDAVGSSAGPFYYWIRFVTRDGVMGPWNAVSGVSASTATDPAYLLGLLAGSITEASLKTEVVGGKDAFVFNTKTFAIKYGSTGYVPFIVQTVPTTINGHVISPGVYLDEAFMRRFVAQSGQIGALAVDDAAIANLSAAKLTAGDGTIGGRLKSTFYAPGVSGWQVNPDGTAEFNDVLVRGTVYAESGYFKGTLVGGAATAFSSGTGLWAGYHSGLYKMHVGNPTGAGFTWDGSTFTIRGADGSVLLASGSGVPYDKVSGVPTSLSEINSGEATKLAGIQAGATVGADASNLSVGLGVNLLFNTEFSGGPSPATQTWNPGGCAAMAVDSGKAWIPPGVRMLYIDQGVQSGNADNVGSDVSLVGGLGAGATTPIPVIAGRRYEFSAIMAVSYCDAALHVVFYDAANNSLLDATSGFVARAGGGAALSSWTQGVTFATAPAGAVYAVPYWRRTETDAGQAHSYAWLAHPYFGEALASQTGASVYAPGGVLSTNQLVDGAGLGSTALWSGVSGSGKPEDNATVGAAFGVNISGQISASNVSTYIAGAAIGVAQIDLVSANRLVVGAANIASAAVGLAQIDLASANKLVVGTANIADAAVGSLQLSGSIQSDNFVTGSAGWQIRKSDGWAEFQGVTVRGNVYDTRPYTVGNTVLIGHPTPFVPVLPNSSTPVKCKEIMVARTGTVRVYAEAFPGINWTSAATHVMYVRKNGTTVTGGTTLWFGDNTDKTVKTTTVDVSVSPGDLISVWLQSQPLNGNGIQNMRLMAGSIYYESITY